MRTILLRTLRNSKTSRWCFVSIRKTVVFGDVRNGRNVVWEHKHKFIFWYWRKRTRSEKRDYFKRNLLRVCSFFFYVKKPPANKSCNRVFPVSFLLPRRTFLRFSTPDSVAFVWIFCRTRGYLTWSGWRLFLAEQLFLVVFYFCRDSPVTGGLALRVRHSWSLHRPMFNSKRMNSFHHMLFVHWAHLSGSETKNTLYTSAHTRHTG